MEELYQGSLHASIKHPKTDMSCPVFEPRTFCTAGEHSTKELLQQFTLFAIRNLCMAATVHVAITHQLKLGTQKARM
jgi:hypothetical protein